MWDCVYSSEENGRMARMAGWCYHRQSQEFQNPQRNLTGENFICNPIGSSSHKNKLGTNSDISKQHFCTSQLSTVYNDIGAILILNAWIAGIYCSCFIIKNLPVLKPYLLIPFSFPKMSHTTIQLFPKYAKSIFLFFKVDFATLSLRLCASYLGTLPPSLPRFIFWIYISEEHQANG